MPSYNLNLDFPSPPARPPPPNRHRPSPLILGPRNNSVPPLSPNLTPSAALVKSPSSPNGLGGRWNYSSPHYRSPLALSSSNDPEAEVANRIREHHHVQFSQRAPPPSRRYVRPPPKSASAAIQEFHILPNVNSHGGETRNREAMFEEMVARALDRRLREKVNRSRIGERAGMGVNAGREMAMLAALGRVREARRKLAERDALSRAPMSAPAGRQTFSIDSSPLRHTPPPSVLLQRALGHRKSSSSATQHHVSGHQRAPSLDTIRGFIARRSSGTTKPSFEKIDEIAPVIVIDLNSIDVAPPVRKEAKLRRKERKHVVSSLSVATILEEGAPPPTVEIRLSPTGDAPSVIEYKLPTFSTRSIPASAPPTTQTFPSSRSVPESATSTTLPVSLPTRPPRAARPKPVVKRQSYVSALPTLPVPVRARTTSTTHKRAVSMSFSSLDDGPARGEFKPMRETMKSNVIKKSIYSSPSPLIPATTFSSSFSRKHDRETTTLSSTLSPKCGREIQGGMSSYTPSRFGLA